MPRDFAENVFKFKMDYLDFRSKDEGLRFEDEMRKHEVEVRRILSKENLEKLDKGGLLTLASNLYASIVWTKKRVSHRSMDKGGRWAR